MEFTFPNQGKPTIWGCLPKFSYVSRRLHEQWAEPPRKFENDCPLGCGVILTTMIEGQQFCMSKILSYMQFYNGTRAKQMLSIHVQADTRLLVVRQHQHGQDVMFSCTSRSKAFRKQPFQAMTFNASATNSSDLEQATVVVPSEFVVEWSNY